MSNDTNLRRTALYDLHRELGARMVPFAGYSMPVQYHKGVLREHLHTRAKVGLFDVSHMGQARIQGQQENDAAAALERLVPGDLKGLAPGRQRYTMLLNKSGGILDDLITTRPQDSSQDIYIVVNAARKRSDFDLLDSQLADTTILTEMTERSLLALQGPDAAAIVGAYFPGVEEQTFMSQSILLRDGVEFYVSRSGYTGEDGFEISLPDKEAEGFARELLALEAVEPVGLGARDSLRLEAGLCLYGDDLDETVSPIEAGLSFAVNRSRRERADFPGAERILKELEEGPSRRRVGILPQGRTIARKGAEIKDPDGERVGVVTSGSYGPSLERPVAMGYVESRFAEIGSRLSLTVRAKEVPAEVSAMPFVPHRYYRRNKSS